MPPKSARPKNWAAPTAKHSSAHRPHRAALAMAVVLASFTVRVAARAEEQPSATDAGTADGSPPSSPDAGPAPVVEVAPYPGRQAYQPIAVGRRRSATQALFETTVTAPAPAPTVPREDRAAAASVVLPSESPRAYDDLGSLLLQVPGVTVARTGASQAFTTLTLRGSNPDQVAIYVDGVLLDIAEGGGVDHLHAAAGRRRAGRGLSGGRRRLPSVSPPWAASFRSPPVRPA